MKQIILTINREILLELIWNEIIGGNNKTDQEIKEICLEYIRNFEESVRE